jgi:hypothetical protein
MKTSPEIETDQLFAASRTVIKFVSDCMDLIDQGTDISMRTASVRNACKFLTGALTEIEKEQEDLNQENTNLLIDLARLAMPLIPQKDQQEIFAEQSKFIAKASLN